MMQEVINCQADLIEALDAQDADDILSASNALADAVERFRLSPGAPVGEHLAFGLKLSEAARIRVKYLTAWNRQKIDRLAECRSKTYSATYARGPK